jgi:hypothetical protein
LLAAVQQATRPGLSSADLLGALATGGGSSPGPVRRGRGDFAPGALQVLDDLARFWEDRRFPAEVALEFLVFSALRHLEPSERQALAVLDLDLLAALLRRSLLQAPGHDIGPDSDETTATPGAATDRPVLLPPELAPSEDLTFRASIAAPCKTFPFDGEPQFERLFDEVCRVLHRQHANHVLLVGERGVGKSTVVAELARRAAGGGIPFLAEKRLLSVDCRYVSPDESRDRIAAVFGHVAGHAELVVCLHGFTSLLRADRPGGNKAALLSAMSRLRCQVIALLTPREYESYIADDPDFAEFFTRVDVEEPDPAVALKILRHFAAGLEQKHQVRIDPEAVRQAVLLSANYVLNDQLPAKALKILRSICEDRDYERGQLGLPNDQVAVDVLAGPGRILQGAHGQLDGLLGEMDHVLGADLLHVPEVGGVGRAEVAVGCPFAPAIEGQLESAHHVLPGQDRVFLVPHNGLAEVQAVFPEKRREIPEVRVPGPAHEDVSRQQHAGHVAEPGVEQLMEVAIGEEVVGERPVLGPEFLRGRLRLVREALDIELLVVRRAGEGAEAGGNSVVRPRLDIHSIRRIGVDQVNRGAVEQAIHVLGLGAIAAQQAVLTEEPQVAGLGDGSIRRLRLSRDARART